MKGADRIIEVIYEAGIDYVFGLPGGSTFHLFNALFNYRDQIRVILARHEQTASVMADMYGRLTGKPGVLIAQGIYAGSLGLFGIMGGFYASSPMVVLADISERGFFAHLGPAQGGSGDYGSVNLRDILGATTKYVTMANTPSEGVICVQQAIKHALIGRPGPTSVIFSQSALVGELEGGIPPLHDTRRMLISHPPPADPSLVEEACRKLRKAKRPLIIAGNGVHSARAYDELLKVAEGIDAPVVTTYLGKSTIPETHHLGLGMMGTYGTEQANKAISMADVIFVVGSRLSPTNTCYMSPRLIHPKQQTIIHLDIEPRNIGWNYPADLSLVGDVKVVLKQIVHALTGMSREPRSEDWPPPKIWPDIQEEVGQGWDSEPVHPRRLVHEINQILPPDALVTVDAGNNRLWMCHDFRPLSVRSFYAPGGLAGMGWSLPASLMAKMLLPERPVIAITGDGGMAVVMDVFLTAHQYNVPIVVVVFNDSALGMIHNAQGNQIIATEFSSTDFAAIARGMGAWSRRVTRPTDIGAALIEAIASGRPALIDVLIDRKVNHSTIISSFHEKRADA
jgi:acetolactate synthase-1/2/3 large subunit